MRWFESSYPSHEKPKEISLFSGIFLWFFLFQKIKVQLCFGFVSTLYVVKNVVKKETAFKTTEKNLFRHFSQNEQRASFSYMRFYVTVAQGGKIMSAEKQFPKVIYQTRNEKDLTQAEVAEKDDPERIIMFISDVSCDQRVAERIAKLLTDEQLDPIHVYEVLDDML